MERKENEAVRMFPRSLLICFLTISIVANIGAISHMASKDVTWRERINKGLKIAAQTPDRIDNFLAQNIKKIAQAENPGAKKVEIGIAFFAFVSFVLMFLFFHRLIGWVLNLARPPESEERAGVISFLLTVVLMFALTRFTWIQAIAEVA